MRQSRAALLKHRHDAHRGAGSKSDTMPTMLRWTWALALFGGALAFAADAPSPLARELRARAATGADVVVLGNSKVATDLNLAEVRAAIGPRAPTMVGLGVNGTQAPVWYAVASQYVVAAGIKPKAYLVYGPLQAALTTTLPHAGGRAALALHLDATAPPNLARVFGGALTPALLSSYTQAVGNVCDAARAALPELASPVSPLPVEQSFLADLVRLASAQGARLIFVRQPFGVSKAGGDVVSPADEAAARTLVLGAKGGWLDLRAELADERWYGDGIHMNEAGRHATSRVLGQRLAALGDWIGRTPKSPAALASVPDLSWSTPPRMPVVTFAQAGDCLATATLPPELAAVGPAALAAAGFAGATPLVPRFFAAALAEGKPGRSKPCAHTWSLADGVLGVAVLAAKQKGVSVTLPETAAAVGNGGHQGWWVGPGAVLDVGAGPLRGWAPAGGASLSVGSTVFEVPAGSFGVVAPAGAVRSERAWVLLTSTGGVHAPAPRTVDLFGGTLVAGPPPTLPAQSMALHKGRPWSVSAEVPALGVPDTDEAYVQSGVGACSPLRVEAGRSVSLARGRLTVANEGCSPFTESPTVALSLADDRACPRNAGRWVYPGDRQVWRVPVSGEGADWAFELAGGVMGEGNPARIDIRMADDTGPLLAVSFAAEELRTAPPRWPLSRAPKGTVEVTVTSPGTAPWVLLGRAALVALPGGAP